MTKPNEPSAVDSGTTSQVHAERFRPAATDSERSATNLVRRRLAFAVAAFLAVTGCLPIAAAEAALASATLADAIERARTLIQKEFAPKAPGVSVAVGVGGKIVWSEGFGFKDLAAKTPVTPATRFRIGSVSKSLTSAALALLVERGQLDLDAPVQKYVPDFPDKGAPITTRLLGGHLAVSGWCQTQPGVGESKPATLR